MGIWKRISTEAPTKEEILKERIKRQGQDHQKHKDEIWDHVFMLVDFYEQQKTIWQKRSQLLMEMVDIEADRAKYLAGRNLVIGITTGLALALVIDMTAYLITRGV